MFGISFTEFLVIICIAMVFIKPEDVPSIIKTGKILLKKLSLLKKEYSKTIHQLQKELDIEEEDDEDPKVVLDESGKPHIAYNIDELKTDLVTKNNKYTAN